MRALRRQDGPGRTQCGLGVLPGAAESASEPCQPPGQGQRLLGRSITTARTCSASGHPPLQECTTFHFDVKPDALRPALDRFAQFFLAPLIKADALGREVQAVDNEFAGVLQVGRPRLPCLLCSAASPALLPSLLCCLPCPASAPRTAVSSATAGMAGRQGLLSARPLDRARAAWKQ